MVGNVRDAVRSLSIYKNCLVEAKPNLGAQEVSGGSLELKIFPSLPLLNFLGLLLFAVQRGKPETFRQLRLHYAAHIKEVGTWDEVRDKTVCTSAQTLQLTLPAG